MIYSANGSTPMNVSLLPNETWTQLADLDASGVYNVTIIGETKCGFGRESAVWTVINDGLGAYC